MAGGIIPFVALSCQCAGNFTWELGASIPAGSECIRTKVCREYPQHVGLILEGLQQFEMGGSIFPNFLVGVVQRTEPAVKSQ